MNEVKDVSPPALRRLKLEVESQSAADGQSSTGRSVVARQSRGAATKLAGSRENRDVEESNGRCCGMPCGQH